MTRFHFRRFAILLPSVPLLAAGVLAAGPIDPNNPPHGRFSDEWAEIYMGGNKVGYAHSAMTRQDDLIRTDLVFHMKLGRVDQPVAIEIAQSFVETAAGVPVNFSSEMNMSAVKSATRGTVKDGRVEIVSSQFGMENRNEFDFPKGAVMAWGSFREMVLRGFEPGTEYTLDTYAPELRMDAAVKAKTRVGEWETFTHAGQTRKGQRVTVDMETPMGSMQMISWVDEFGTPQKSKIPVPGMGDMVLVATDQKTAMADFLPPEFFMKTTIKADRKIDQKAANRITYRLTSMDPAVNLSDLPETASQRILDRADRHVDLVVERLAWGGTTDEATGRQSDHGHGTGSSDRGSKGSADTEITKSPNPQVDQSQVPREYLCGNLMINTEDPKLIELAKRAAGGETQGYALADKLRQFVTEYVASKTLNIGFATASEVARNKEGDCSEHGVLLAALARINGLPSRVAVGLAYVPVFGGQEDIFGYHMWTQVYIDGRWIDIDAALRETECSPIRITFATSSLQNAGVADLSLPLISKLGAIDLKILDVK